jgi:putative endonuclease
MNVFSTVIFGFVAWAARKGLAPEGGQAPDADRSVRHRTGVRGETYAYWFLRRHGYVVVGRNFTVPGVKGEIDLIAYDGAVLAFVEVKTRTGEPGEFGLPEDAVTFNKRRALSRMARQFLVERRIRDVPYRFDVVAIESQSGRAPAVRLHKGAFADR